MTELTRFGVIGLLHFHNEISEISCGWISLSKFSVCLKGYILLYKRKRIFDTKKDYKESVLLLLHKSSVLFYRGVRDEKVLASKGKIKDKKITF